MGRNQLITPTGWWSFFNSLQTRATRLKNLDISHTMIDSVGITALGSLLNNMSMLKSLKLNGLSSNGPDNITTQGWVSFLTALHDSNLDLDKLDLGSNCIDDEGMQILIQLLVSNMSSLKCLELGYNRQVTPTGWQALTVYLQSPNFALEQLGLHQNNINDDIVIAFASVLAQNNTLERLALHDCFDEDNNESITERGWGAFSNLGCNKTTIMDTYNSNHTLYRLSEYLPDDLESYLELNKNKDKKEVARQKILQSHFSTEDGDTPKIQELLDMELEVMPSVITWIGRPAHAGWRGTNVSGLSTMFNLTRRLPDLFDSSAQKKPGKAKRKRNIL